MSFWKHWLNCYKLVALPFCQNHLKWKYFKSKKTILCKTENCGRDYIWGRAGITATQAQNFSRICYPRMSENIPALMYFLSWEMYMYHWQAGKQDFGRSAHCPPHSTLAGHLRITVFIWTTMRGAWGFKTGSIPLDSRSSGSRHCKVIALFRNSYQQDWWQID